IIPAPSNLMYGYDGGTAQPVACLALVELADGDREIRAMGLTNCEIFEEQTGAVLFFE
ncbi:hypothetical protein HMPREF0239_01759, partial [Clostridium sp. ATCC BAA-442]